MIYLFKTAATTDRISNSLRAIEQANRRK